jgi:hypothetical protein
LSYHRIALFISACLICFTAVRLATNISVAKQRKEVWDQVALHTHLTYQAGNPLLGYPLYLSGTYRGHSIVLHHSYQISTTHFKLGLANLTDDVLRLRGPLHKNEIGAEDQVTTDMFHASGHREVGQFFVRGPLHLTTNLLVSESVAHSLAQLLQPINVELRKQTLYIDYPQVVYDPQYLCFLLDLSCDLADAIERKSRVKAQFSSTKMGQ